MRRTILSAALVAAAGAAQAGPMGEACLARGTWDAATCTCIEGVAADELPPEQHELAAEFFMRRITSQQIAARHGVAYAQDFLQRLADFMAASTAACGAP